LKLNNQSPLRLSLALLGALAAILFVGCGNSDSESDAPATKSVRISTEGWAELPEVVTAGDLAELLGEEVPGTSCTFSSSEAAGEGPEAQCGGSTYLKVSTSDEEPKDRSTCRGNDSEGWICEENEIGANIYAEASSVAKAEVIMKSVFAQLAEFQEEHGGEATPEPEAVGIATSQQGDRVQVRITSGTPEPMNDVSIPVVNACKSGLAEYDQSPERAMVIPLDVDATVLSNLSTDLVVDLSDFGVVEGEGYAELGFSSFWAEDFSEGPECEAGTDGGSVHWAAEELAPGDEAGWEAYLILPDVITPNSPGTETANHVVIAPSVRLSGLSSEIHYKSDESPGVVNCEFGSDGFGLEPVFAVNARAAQEYGCTG
jgi:hypothetical protein